MANQRNANSIAMEAKAIRIAYIDPLPEVAPKTLDEIIAILNLADDPRCAGLRRRLAHAARSYLVWKEVLADSMSPRKARTGFARLVRGGDGQKHDVIRV